MNEAKIKGMRTVAIFVTLSLLCWAGAGFGQDLAITGCTVYASPEAAAQRSIGILIQHGMITAVGPRLPIPKGVQTISCSDCVVLAGFWNSHVHFIESKWNDADRQPTRQLTLQMGDMLTRSGFTTVVDMGSDVVNTVALRRRIDSGEVLGPQIFTAGIPLFPAHALPYYLDDLPEDFRAKMGQPETAAQAAALVRQNRAAGSNIEKLFTGSIVGPNRIAPMLLEIARAAVEEAHSHGQPVFAHTSNFEGTKIALDAGVDVLAHSPQLTAGIDKSMLQHMVAQGTTIIPTLKLFSKDRDIAKIRDLDYQFHQLGGKLVYGTDTGFLQDYDQSEEFRQLIAAGFSFRDVLAMLTVAPAQLFHLSKVEGKVIPGMRGDLTILSKDPESEGPEAFAAVIYTIRSGTIIWRAQ